MPYCEHCGSQLNPNAKFCTNCGAAQIIAPAPPQHAIQPPQYFAPPTSSPPPPPPPPMEPSYQPPPPIQPPTYQPQPPIQPPAATLSYGSERVIGVLLFRKPKSLGRWDTYTGVITGQRIIFAQMTQQMMNDAVKQSRDQAKAERKGFWGQWADQLRATFGYSQRYLSMQPDVIVAETPGNFYLNNDSIGEIKVKLKSLDRENTRNEFSVEFRSNAGKYEYHMDENSDSTDLLKKVYGDRVKMPFGYFSKTINIKI
jgi:hypothetical protein